MEKLNKKELKEFINSYSNYLKELEEQEDLDTMLQNMYMLQVK